MQRTLRKARCDPGFGISKGLGLGAEGVRGYDEPKMPVIGAAGYMDMQSPAQPLNQKKLSPKLETYT